MTTISETNRPTAERFSALLQAQLEREKRKIGKRKIGNGKRFGRERQLEQLHRKNVQKIWSNSRQSDCHSKYQNINKDERNTLKNKCATYSKD